MPHAKLHCTPTSAYRQLLSCRILDNLPVAMVKTRKDDKGQPMKVYERGYYVGFKATIEVINLHAQCGACQQHVHTSASYVMICCSHNSESWLLQQYR